ncbi:MAG TPA: ATP-binding protein [Ktedonobacterales bacterium]|jgi:signal transduction histidine kinase
MLLNSKRIYSTKRLKARPIVKTVPPHRGAGGADLLSALPWQAAILDQDGAIIAVNEAWRRFAAEDGASSFPESGLGLNYFDVSRPAFGQHEETAQQAYQGIREVLTGERALFTLEYPYPSRQSPANQRWFQLTVTPLASGQPGALLQRLDVTTVTARAQGRDEREGDATASEALGRMELFISIAAHEFRTPLAVINGQIELAERKLRVLAPQDEQATALATASLQGSLDAAQRAADRLGSLLDNLLEVTHARTGRLTIQPAWCDLVTLVRDLVADQRQLHPSRRLRLHLDRQRHIYILADPVRLAQVVTNYLNNACKYSPMSRPIWVDVHAEKGKARVSVRDQGPGLAPGVQTQIWERFYQAPDIRPQSGSDVGLGLGLYISRLIVEQHGGEVGVESEVGKGATFWCTVPLRMQVS